SRSEFFLNVVLLPLLRGCQSRRSLPQQLAPTRFTTHTHSHRQPALITSQRTLQLFIATPTQQSLNRHYFCFRMPRQQQLPNAQQRRPLPHSFPCPPSSPLLP